MRWPDGDVLVSRAMSRRWGPKRAWSDVLTARASYKFGERRRKRPVNFFHLFAHGEAFDPDAFLATTTLRPDHVWRRGEPRRGYEDIEGLRGHDTGGVEFVLGDGRAIPYPRQE